MAVDPDEGTDKSTVVTLDALEFVPLFLHLVPAPNLVVGGTMFGLH